MRTLKKFGVLAVAVFALSVVGVASASAAQFTASETGELTGKALESQTFTVSGGTVVCSTAATTGKIIHTAAEEQEVTVNYSGCKAFSIVSVDITPATYLFHSNGKVDIKEPITITVTGGILGNCTVNVPAQSALGTVAFETANTNNTKVTPNVSGITYTTSGGLCGSGGSNGTYKGANEVSRVGGGFLRFDS